MLDHRRRQNVFALTLGPHGSDLHGVVQALSCSTELDRGYTVSVGGNEIFFCAFTQAYINDMPQQLDSAGFMRQISLKGCGKCLVLLSDSGNLDFKPHVQTRSHLQTQSLCEQIRTVTRTIAEQFCKAGSGPITSRTEWAGPSFQTRSTSTGRTAHTQNSKNGQNFWRFGFIAHPGYPMRRSQKRMYCVPICKHRLRRGCHGSHGTFLSLCARGSRISVQTCQAIYPLCTEMLAFFYLFTSLVLNTRIVIVPICSTATCWEDLSSRLTLTRPVGKSLAQSRTGFQKRT